MLETHVPGAVERVGALLEMHLSKHASWELGAVERESGHIEAYVLVGFGRSPAHLHFDLNSAAEGKTRVCVSVKTKSRFSTQKGCLALAQTALDEVCAKSQP